MTRWRSVAALIAVCLGVAGVAPRIFTWQQFVGGVGPSLLGAWGLFALFVVSSTAVGAAIVRWASPRARPDGFWPLAFASGAAVFALSNGFFGWLQLIGPKYFVLLPMTLLALGWRAGVTEVLASLAARRDRGERFSPLEVLALGFGLVCIGLVGLQTLAPDNVNYDAAWYHLRAAERYALAGGQVRTPEGDLLLALPQTASWLYTWAFLWPIAGIDDHVRLSLLLEFGTVLGTVAAIPALVRTLAPSLPREVTRLSWIAFFFFPTIFIYDTGLMGGADHIVALWSVTALLVWYFARRANTGRAWVLFGLHIAGLLAKYSSIYVLVPLVVLVGCDWLWRWKKAGRAFAAGQKWGPILTAIVGLALTSPYWLRNAIWYHNPLYPAASHTFPSTPWNEDAEAWEANTRESTVWAENGTLAHKADVSARALFNYQTDLNTWGDLTEGQPIAGAIYFLSLLALPFIPGRKRRLVVLAVIVNVGIVVWYNTHQHQMRYLTVLMAPMAAGAAAVAVSLWRAQWLAGKLAVGAAIAYHLAAFADMPFRKTHRMAGGESTVGVAANFLARHGTRAEKFVGWEKIGDSLPPSAVPLVHSIFPHLGMKRQSVTDITGLQYGINYGRWGSQKEILRHLRLMGVTHAILNPGSEQSDSVTGEALFLGLVVQSPDKQVISGFRVYELPPVAHEIGEGILYVGCGNLYKSGLYTLEALKAPIPPWFHPFPVPPIVAAVEGDWHTLLPRASYVALEADCGLGDPPAEFTFMSEQAGWPKRLRHFVRTSGQAEGWGPGGAPVPGALPALDAGNVDAGTADAGP